MSEEHKHERTQPPQGGSWLRRYWKRMAIGAIVVFVLFNVGRSVLPAFGLTGLTGGGGGNQQASQPTAKTSSSPPPTVDLNGVNVPGGGQPILMLNPGLAQPGGTIKANGSGFDPGSRVDVSLAAGTSSAGASATPAAKADGKEQRVASATTAKDGSISTSFTFPSQSAGGSGNRDVIARQRGSDKTATAEVVPAAGTGVASLSLTTGRPGDTVTLTAHGFAPGEDLAVYWGRTNGTPSATAHADGSGSVGQTPVRVGTTATGTTNLFVVGTKSGNAAAVPFQVLGLYPTVTVKPYAAKAGQRVTFSGKGFAPGERVLVHLNSAAGRPVMSLPTDAGGSFGGAGITVPYTLKGQQALVVVGDQSRASVNSGFSVLPYQPAGKLSSYNGLPGLPLKFSATGFAPNEAVHVFTDRGSGKAGTLVSAFRVDGFGNASGQGKYQIPGDGGNQQSFSLVGARSGASVDITIKVDRSSGPLDIPPAPPYQLPKNLEN
jgi:hypothetical protein